MNRLTGLFYDLIDRLTELVKELPMFLWEHKMWVFALLPVLGAYALYKYLYS